MYVCIYIYIYVTLSLHIIHSLLPLTRTPQQKTNKQDKQKMIAGTAKQTNNK